MATPDAQADRSSRSSAIVTGAGGAIGRAISLTLAKAGWFVVACDIDRQSLATTVQDIEELGAVAGSHILDVGDPQAVVDFFENFVKAGSNIPALALLVNNAGIQTWSPLLELSYEDWSRTLKTNLDGCFLMTQQFGRMIKAQDTSVENPSIVNIGSGCNKLAFPGLVDYSASKGGIEMFTKSAALELGQYGIRVNCLAPGAISNERTAVETADYDASWAALTPLERVGTPDDVARCVLLLADSSASFISGQTIGVDGGLFSRAIWPQQY